MGSQRARDIQGRWLFSHQSLRDLQFWRDSSSKDLEWRLKITPKPQSEIHTDAENVGSAFRRLWDTGASIRIPPSSHGISLVLYAKVRIRRARAHMGHRNSETFVAATRSSLTYDFKS